MVSTTARSIKDILGVLTSSCCIRIDNLLLSNSYIGGRIFSCNNKQQKLACKIARLKRPKKMLEKKEGIKITRLQDKLMGHGHI